MISYQCPKCGESAMVLVAPTFRLEPRALLWWQWVAKMPAGYLVRCTRHGCGRAWRVGLDGVQEPAGAQAIPSPNTRRPQRDEDDGEPLEYDGPAPLDNALRRVDLSDV